MPRRQSCTPKSAPSGLRVSAALRSRDPGERGATWVILGDLWGELLPDLRLMLRHFY